MMEIRDWLLTISMIGHFSYTIWAYVERRSDKTNERIAELNEKIEVLERDVSSMKTATESAPTHGDLAKVYEAVNRTNQTVHTLVGEFKQQSEVLRLIHSFLLHGGKG